MEDNQTFEYLGKNFQFRLLNQILTDKKFASNILDILEVNYFEDEYLRKIASIIKDVFEESNTIPDFESIKIRINDQVKEELKRKIFSSTLQKISDADKNDIDFVRRKAFDFCRQQELKKALARSKDIVDKGRSDSYDKCVDIIQGALEAGKDNDDASDLFDGIEDVIEDDYRNPIGTHIDKLDEIMNGGLAKTELGVILAALGVGKTSILTKIANSAKEQGYNVLQIFFEDHTSDIKRKHLSAWTNIDINHLKDYKEEVKKVASKKEKEPGGIKLKKFSSAGTTIPKIKQYVRKVISQGFTPDIVIIDYIDCVSPSKSFKEDDIHQSEGHVMREFESMLGELDLAGWTAVQGNRSSIGSDIVDASQMGGSIKKAQVGHFVMSIAKALEQKEHGRANMAILKSRVGRDGLTFNDVIFENETMNINIPSDVQSKTFLEEKQVNQQKEKDRVTEIIEANKNNGNNNGENNEQ